jgi:flavin-dependent dehydrogenase
MTAPSRAYDVIIVGARVAGTAAAIALGRARLNVLVLDKAAFPSDTISTHVVLGGGTRVLARMGVLGELERLGGVRFARMRTIGPDFDYDAALAADYADDERGLCLGRLRMDRAMVDAARSLATVEVRERFRVTGLVIDHGGVAGVRGQDPAGEHVFTAPLVIGADGIRSTVASFARERLGAFRSEQIPCARAYYYAYFDGVPAARFGDELVTELEARPGAGSLVCRCEDGRVVAAVAFDAREMTSFRARLGENFAARLRESPFAGALLRDARMVGKVRSSGLLANYRHDPAADGALLLGDAGLHVDPLFGQGHSFALMSAEALAEHAPRWFGARNGALVERGALAEFTRARDRALMRYYDASVRVSRLLGLDSATAMAHRAAADEPWAAREMVRFAQMLDAEGAFPSFRFARLMARQRAAQPAPHGD